MVENSSLSSDKGQHLIVDEAVVKKAVDCAELGKNEYLIEIGAGKGALTSVLAKQAYVAAYEVDLKFKDDLVNLAKDFPSLTLHFEDALKADWSCYTKLVANIPFALSEAVLMKMIYSSLPAAVLFIGDDCKLKLEQETKLGMIVRLFYILEIIEEIPSKAFLPQPKTRVWLVRLQKRLALTREDMVMQSVILKKGKIKNALVGAFMQQGLTKREAKEKVNTLKLDKNVLDKPVTKITANLFALIKSRIEI